MPGPLSDLVFPAKAELLRTAWEGWWKHNRVPPQPDKLTAWNNQAFWEWRDVLLENQMLYLVERLGDRLLKLYDRVCELADEYLDTRSWEWPIWGHEDPEENDDQTAVIEWVAWVLAMLRWNRKYDHRDIPELTMKEVAEFLLNPPPIPMNRCRATGQERIRPGQPSLF